MFLYCIFIFLCFDFSSFFPVQNCNTQYKRLLAVLDCRGGMEEQKDFMKSFSDHIESNQKIGFVELILNKMVGDNCSKNENFDPKYRTFSYNKTLPLSSVLEATKQFKEFSNNSCSFFSASFIFLFNIKDINNKNNTIMRDILNTENGNTAYNRFFIIQTSEKLSHNYTSMDFIHFTSSFKSLNVMEIFNKICDSIIDGNTLSYSGRNDFKSDYRIVNQSAEVTGLDIICFCKKNHGMALISLEFYDEFVEIIQFINNLTTATGSGGINILFALFNRDGNFEWHNSKNPYTFSRPFNITPESLKCFYFNVSTYTDTIINHDKNLYNLGKYMVEIDCNKPLQNPLVICEGENVIPEQMVKQMNSVTDMSALTGDHVYKTIYFYFFSGSYTQSPLLECNSYTSNRSKSYQSKWAMHSFKGYTCFSSNNKVIYRNFHYARNNFITLLYKGTHSFYTLTKVNISDCSMYNKCQNMSNNESDNKLSNQNVDIFCVDESENKAFHDTCSIHSLSFNLTLEYVQCESNKSQYSLKCIKQYGNQCEDNSNLRNCENFICPKPFIKCFNSYCIFPEMMRTFFHDCPHGEDEVYSSYKIDFNFKCEVYLIIFLRELCIDLNTFQFLSPMLGNDTEFVCVNVCPNNYKCVSDKIKGRKIIRHYQLHIKGELISNNNILHIMNHEEEVLNSHLYSVVSMDGSNCGLKNFDYELQYRNMKELVKLDISCNKINHSNYLKSVERFSQLKFLNLSHNENLIIGSFFDFPRSLEILDLSYTKINSLRNHIFVNLKNLKHLNLSHTFITQFKDMGLPEFFTLDTFYIQHLKIQNIDKNFFRGLTIHSELKASDYVLCCPQILNTNISADKCHAPVDLISSCKQLVSDTFKRIVIWVVGLLTVVGNGIVLVYRIVWDREIFKKAYGHFITGLAMSDLFMGVYLIIIAIADAYYKDVYVSEDFHWRHGFVCNLCGFLSTLSSEASTFFVCLITVDRYLCITYPFGEHRFSKPGKLIVYTLVWLVGFVLALIPVFLSDLQIYSSNGLCLALPFSPIQNKGWIFSFVVFVGLNFMLFLFIAFGQLTIFKNLIKANKSIVSVTGTQNIQRRSEELTVAIKLALVAFTNFCCWFPVGILGFLSFNGYIFNREVYAWFGVFVLPINAALNPIIYTIPAVYGKCKTLYEIYSH